MALEEKWWSRLLVCLKQCTWVCCKGNISAIFLQGIVNLILTFPKLLEQLLIGGVYSIQSSGRTTLWNITTVIIIVLLQLILNNHELPQIINYYYNSYSQSVMFVSLCHSGIIPRILGEVLSLVFFRGACFLVSRYAVDSEVWLIQDLTIYCDKLSYQCAKCDFSMMTLM